jgi:hypothetical protein
MPPVIILTPTKAPERTGVFTWLAHVLTALACRWGVGPKTRVSGNTSRRRSIRLAMPDGVARSPIMHRAEPTDHMRRQTRGFMPVCRVKTRLKWLWSPKPQPKAIWESDRLC